MELVIDANILFAALLKEGKTSEMLFKHTIYAPEFIFEEFKKYKDELQAKTKRDDFNELLELFERNVILVPKEEIEPLLKTANEISPDEKDIPYFALALKQKCSIWSNDKRLKDEQQQIKVYTTDNLATLQDGHK